MANQAKLMTQQQMVVGELRDRMFDPIGFGLVNFKLVNFNQSDPIG